MTDDELKSIIESYIVDGAESDNGDCLYERDEFSELDDGEWDKISDRLYTMYGKARVEVSFDD